MGNEGRCGRFSNRTERRKLKILLPKLLDFLIKQEDCRFGVYRNATGELSPSRCETQPGNARIPGREAQVGCHQGEGLANPKQEVKAAGNLQYFPT